MAMIHVNRAGTSLGVFAEEDVREGLRTGRFAGTDLGWREGMAQWQRLSQFSEFASELPPGAPPPPVGTVATSTSPAPRSGLPWDERQQRGLFGAFIETLQMVLSRPSEAFIAMKREGGLGEPLIYALIGGSAGYIVYLVFLFFMPSLAFMGDRHNAVAGIFGMGLGLIFAVIFIPIGLTLGIFI